MKLAILSSWSLVCQYMYLSLLSLLLPKVPMLLIIDRYRSPTSISKSEGILCFPITIPVARASAQD